MTLSYQRQNVRPVVLFLCIAAGLLFLVAATQFIATRCGLTWNVTASLPKGYYRLAKTGPLVEFCPQGQAAALANQRRYRPEGSCPDGFVPLLKPIAAQPGDLVTVSDRGVSVNGKLLPNTRQFPYDAQHRPMLLVPHGTYVVAPHTLWVISTYSTASYDSRYYGPIQDKDVIAHASPFLTF